MIIPERILKGDAACKAHCNLRRELTCLNDEADQHLCVAGIMHVQRGGPLAALGPLPKCEIPPPIVSLLKGNETDSRSLLFRLEVIDRECILPNSGETDGGASLRRRQILHSGPVGLDRGEANGGTPLLVREIRHSVAAVPHSSETKHRRPLRRRKTVMLHSSELFFEATLKLHVIFAR